MAATKWRNYQHATARVFQKLGFDAEVEYLAQGVRARHKVDVHVRFAINGIRCTWIVECKLWTSRVSKEKVMALKSIVEDLGADRGIIFCEKGFQPGATAAAHGTNITLVTSIRDFAEAAMDASRSKAGPVEVAEIFDTFAEELDDVIEGRILSSSEATPTRVEQIKARRGQGIFRAHVLQMEHCCRLTGISNPQLLQVTHLKPWRSCTKFERTDGNNGLVFAPTAHLLFDRGLVSFRDSGSPLLSPSVKNIELSRLGVNQGLFKPHRPFLEQQRQYLAYHRQYVFRGP